MADRKLIVEVIGDDRSFQQALNRSTVATKQFESRFTKLNQSLRGGLAGTGVGARGSLLFGSGAFIGTAAITSALTASVQAASDLNEELAKSQQVFGQASGSVKRWSETTAQAIGVSQRAALEATGTFGNLFNTVGLGQQDAAEMSQALVQLAADLASFNNADISDVLLAIRSGLVGEAEPLRRYGVLLSEARVQQFAMAETGKTNVKSLTDQEKALARYQIILRDTAPAQGDFARTSDSLANQSRILRANLDDLAGNVGGVLIPVLKDATEVANALFIALDAFRGVDFSPGFDFPDPPDWLTDIAGLAIVAPISPLGAGIVAANRIIGDQDEQLNQFAQRLRSPDAIDAAEDAAKTRENASKSAQRALDRSQSAFSAFVKGMGLKLDKAGLTATLADDLAALRELESAILRQIQREGRTFKLVSQLVDTRQEIADLVERQAEDAQQAGEDAFNSTLDALNLRLEIAQTSRGLQDDQRALQAIEAAIIDRISSEGRTTELLRQLFQVRQQQLDVARQLQEQRREQRQGDQFEQLGLTREGEEKVPGVGSLKRRAKTLEEQVKGTTLDTQKTRTTLQRIARVLAGDFGKVGRDVRRAILEMLNQISDALNKGNQDLTGPLTKTTSLNSRKILENLGLTEEQERELRARLSNFNSSGQGFAGANRTGTTGTFQGGTRENIVIENNVTVEIDGKKITATVTKQQQKARRRNPLQKRGPNRAGHGGH